MHDCGPLHRYLNCDGFIWDRRERVLLQFAIPERGGFHHRCSHHFDFMNRRGFTEPHEARKQALGMGHEDRVSDNSPFVRLINGYGIVPENGGAVTR